MHSFENSFPTSNTRLSHPNFNLAGEKLKGLLLELSRDPSNEHFRSILRTAADQVRVKAFGYNRASTKRKILKLVAEYHQLETVDLVEETAIAESEIRAACDELVSEGSLLRGRRRRWQEPGKHYNDLFELIPDKLDTIG